SRPSIRVTGPPKSIRPSRCAMSDVALSCCELRKVYLQGEVEVRVLLGVNLSIAKGEHVAIVGASGSGKSTVLHLLGGLDAASSGEVVIGGRDIQALDE